MERGLRVVCFGACNTKKKVAKSQASCYEGSVCITISDTLNVTCCQPSGDIARDIITASCLHGSWANPCFRRPNRDGPDDRCMASATCLRLNFHRIVYGNAADRAAKSGVEVEASHNRRTERIPAMG